MKIRAQRAKSRPESRATLACLGVLCVLAASCGGGNAETGSDTTVPATTAASDVIEADDQDTAAGDEADPGTGDEASGDSADSQSESEESSGDEPVTTDPADGSGLGDSDADHDAQIDVDPEWERREGLWFVWNVASDDVLNVRAEPDADSAVLAVLAHNASGITRYSEVAWNGNTAWGVVELDGRTGWVAVNYLRPEPTGSEQLGEPQRETLPAALATIEEALADRDALADLIGSDGLLLSPDGFVNEDDIVLSADEVAASGSSRIWGYEAGSGNSIEMPVDDYFEWIRGSTALTSTEVTSYGEVVGSGTTINNIDAYFPGSSTVEYHHRGTQYFGGLDWQSIRFVFDLNGDSPILLAIVRDEWTP